MRTKDLVSLGFVAVLSLGVLFVLGTNLSLADSTGSVVAPRSLVGAPSVYEKPDQQKGVVLGSLDISSAGSSTLASLKQKCEEIKSTCRLCNVCKPVEERLRAECASEKDGVRANEQQACSQRLASVENNARAQGSQEGITEMKRRVRGGFVFSLLEGMTCDQFCSRIRGNDGQSLSCVASVKVSYTCGIIMPPPNVDLGSCSEQGSNVQCLCA